MRIILSSAIIILAMTSAASAEGDTKLGEKVFRKCKACHAVGEDAKVKVGPALNEIFGMQAGTQENFEKKYSKAMIAAGDAGLVWNEDTLSTYLAKPKELVEGTKMSFPGLKKEEDRANVIAYLKQFSPEKDTAD